MNIRQILAQCPLFFGVSGEDLDTLAERTHVRSVASGETLLKIGSPADHLYILAVGRMRVELADGQTAGDIDRLQPIGEMSLLSSDTRTATVFAVRDSRVLVIERQALLQLFEAHPSALLAISRTIISRLRQNQRQAALEASRRSRCFALLSASPEVDLAAFASNFAEALGEDRDVRIIDIATAEAALGESVADIRLGEGLREERLMHWLQEMEVDHHHLLYVGGHQASPWARRCVRQADRVIVLADSSLPPESSPAVRDLGQSGLRTPIDLVLIRPEGVPAGEVSAWREAVGAKAHFFLRPGHRRDVDRMARSLTGRSIGLVLGGGGARGFAHIGLVRAIEELGLEVDLVGGTSMGSFIGALMAGGYGSKAILSIVRETFVDRNALNDYVFPKVSLIRGRKFRRRLKEVFEDHRIEDLRTPYFCLSTNLTKGKPMVHDRGPLAIWVGTSMCVPGIAPPVAYAGDLLVDGAVVNSLPTDIMQSMERGPIIASDVSTEGEVRAPGIEGPDPEVLLRWKLTEKRPSLFSILFRTATLTSSSGVEARASLADLYLHMPVGNMGLFDWKRIDEVVEIGYRHAMEQLPPFLEAKSRAEGKT